MKASFHSVEKKPKYSSDGRVGLRLGPDRAVSGWVREAAHTFFPIYFDSYFGRADAEVGERSDASVIAAASTKRAGAARSNAGSKDMRDQEG